MSLYISKWIMKNILKFLTVVASPKSLEKQGRLRSSLIRVFPVCYSDKHFVTSSPDNHYFIWEQKELSVRNFRTFIVEYSFAYLFKMFKKCFQSLSFYPRTSCYSMPLFIAKWESSPWFWRLWTMTQHCEIMIRHERTHQIWTNFCYFSYMGRDVRKPVFRVSDKVRFKPACSATRTS